MESDFTAHLHQAMSDNMWGVYLCLIIAPFVQEDAAVIGAASLSLSGMADSVLVFFFITVGLTTSDLWKYWLGRAARSQAWASRFAQKPAVVRAENLVRNRLGVKLMTARFIPGARIPLYIASGYFQAGWSTFALWIVISAIAYIGLAFALFHAVGAVAGEQAKIWLPLAAVASLAAYLALRRFRHKKAAVWLKAE